MCSILDVVSHVTYELRGYASRAGYERIDAVLEMTRELYNAALEQRRTAWRHGRHPVNYVEQCRDLTELRRGDPAWQALGVVVARGALRTLDRAYGAFFRRLREGQRPGYPRFKPRSRWQTLSPTEVTPSMVRVSPCGRRATLRMRGLPPVRLRLRRALPEASRLRAVRVVRRQRRLDVCLTYEEEREPLPATGQSVGLDLGVTQRVTRSDGVTSPPLQADRDRLRRLQRRLARARRGSRSRARTRAALTREHRRLHVAARNATHRLTSALVRDHDLIAIEDLAPGRMTRSARGTIEEPGTNVAQKRGLNRAIREQRWGMLRQQLTYKAAWAGRQLVAVDPRYTSQDCSRCGERTPGPTPGRRYHCAGCGLVLDRDLNAARNVLRRGLASCGASAGGGASPEAIPWRAAARQPTGALVPVHA